MMADVQFRTLAHAARSLAVALCLTAAVTPSAHAEAIQPIETIRDAARTYLESRNASSEDRIEVVVGRLDSRLRLGRCPVALEAFRPSAGREVGRVSVGVRCPASPAWTLYVSATVRRMAPVVVMAHGRPRGTVLTADDLRIEVLDVARLTRGYASDPVEVTGKQLSRPTVAGHVIGSRDVVARRLVRRGDRVSVLARAGGMEIRSEGLALEDGAAGDVIRVRNVRSRRVVDGVVAAAGTVDVRL